MPPQKNKTGTPPYLTIAGSLQDNQHIAIFLIHSSLQKMIQELKEPDMFICFREKWSAGTVPGEVER